MSMRRFLYLIIYIGCVVTAHAQYQFQKVSLSDALIQLDECSKRYDISFVYDELEDFGTIKKSVILNRIRHLYLEAKGTLTDGSIEDVRAKSDDIFDNVVDNVCKLVGDTHLDEAELFLAVQIVVVDAFIECKVLEKPAV